MHEKIEKAIHLIDVNINEALHTFNECIQQSAEVMKKRIPINKTKSLGDWFDHECVLTRRKVRRLLRTYNKSLKKEDRNNYTVARREYKNLLQRKKREFNDTVLHRLVASIGNQKDFWKNVQNVSFKATQPKSNIDIDTWFKHFKSLLEIDTDSENVSTDMEDVHINGCIDRPISKEEVLMAIRKLKNRKSAGPDGIIGELIKHSNEQMIDFFVKFFNTLFDKGVYPENWMESIILPLFQKGDVNNPNNYRGISLSDVSSKVFGSIINRRLQEWVEENNITNEYQAGFKKGYSTIDHMFTLLALVQKQFSFNRKLYVAFIDFQKAFDSINRSLLWSILLKNGINGKLFRCVKSMYENVKCKVRSGARFTEFINCTAGVKQGDVCSPVLFSVFINELALEVINNGKHGAMLSYTAFELFILLLADDVILLSETVVGLQNQLNTLCRKSSSLQLKINMDKSNIIVFRKGGYLKSRERWVCNGELMPVVNTYKYLGIFFSTRLSFVLACKDLKSKAKNALLCIMRKLYTLHNNSFKLLITLFDSQVQPILQYGSEIWGLDKAAHQCESVHLFAIKRYLGVDSRTPNDLVYGETNRYPVFINSSVNCIRYWLKLSCMDMCRLPHKAYKMLLDLDAKGKQNWVSKVRVCLCQNGFGDVWLSQGVGNVKEFIVRFRQRLIDCRWQLWEDHINTSQRFDFYKSFTYTHELKKYLHMNMDLHLRYIMTKVRLGISDLRVHQFRYKTCNDFDLLCPMCRSAKEDEMHFIFFCHVLKDIREKFIPTKFYARPCLFKLTLLMACTKPEIMHSLSLFLYKAFQLRNHYL